jgi:hypothetical protein
MMTDDDEFMSRKEAALYLTKKGCPVSAGGLANMACNNNAGRGPSLYRFKWRTVRYKKADLDKWAAEQGERIE